MCPFCISAAVSVAAGTVATAGVGALFAFARRIPERVEASDDDARSRRVLDLPRGTD